MTSSPHPRTHRMFARDLGPTHVCSVMASLSSAYAPLLQEQFQRGWEAQKTVESGEMASNSAEFKECVARGISLLEAATLSASQLDLFSANEELEEVASGNLRYLLLPALLGDLTLQLGEEEGGVRRCEIIARARVYLVDYLQRCRAYAITSEAPPPPPLSSEATPPSSEATPPSSGARSYQRLADERAAKIAQYKAQKESEKKLEELTGRLDALSVSGKSPDDELIREHYLTVLQLWVHKSLQLIRSVDHETEMLTHMERMESARGNQSVAKQPEAAPPPPRKPMKPVVITREMLQGGVFGAGYPSLPSMSLEQFYQQEYQQQVEEARQKAAHPKQRVSEEDEEEEKEEGRKEEEEEEGGEALQKAREFDDYKDDHRRGWGNRKNMG